VLTTRGTARGGIGRVTDGGKSEIVVITGARAGGRGVHRCSTGECRDGLAVVGFARLYKGSVIKDQGQIRAR